MLNCFAIKDVAHKVPVIVVTDANFASWLSQEEAMTQHWLKATDFKANAGAFCIIPNETGSISKVICCIKNEDYFWEVGALPFNLPEGDYYFANMPQEKLELASCIWGFGAYFFDEYKKAKRQPAKLVITNTNHERIQNIVESVYLVRDLINRPTDDLGPSELAAAASALAKQYNASYSEMIGEDLKANYPCTYTVGRASDDPPRLIDIRWGKSNHPKLTLVGKGVCFDSGGLDIKPADHMTLMKKDMGGAANVLGLARMIMHANLPVSLRILIPAVENVISGNAFRPGDIIRTPSGKSIEIGNTDAEGRLLLADALYVASLEKPDLIIDLATLTGAARSAVGTDISALMSNNNEVATRLLSIGEELQDYICRLPLFEPYREGLNSYIADMNNCGKDPYAGAIMAALFLQTFVVNDIPWCHFDMMAWNIRTKPGKPVGGEAMAIRALFVFLEQYFLDK